MSSINLNPAEILNRTTPLQPDEMEALRELVERYPYFATARLMLLEQMYRRHDSHFDAELRRSALLLADRRVLFEMVEGANYAIPKENISSENADASGDRMLSLIESFLQTDPRAKGQQKVPSVIDPTQDYVGYMLAKEAEEAMTQDDITLDMANNDTYERPKRNAETPAAPKPKHQAEPAEEEAENEANSESRNATMTESMAQIYIKQHKYDRALEIIRALSLNNPKKNAYFADQIRYLEKLISLNIKQKH